MDGSGKKVHADKRAPRGTPFAIKPGAAIARL
jgi:hypothetical protein